MDDSMKDVTMDDTQDLIVETDPLDCDDDLDEIMAKMDCEVFFKTEDLKTAEVDVDVQVLMQLTSDPPCTSSQLENMLQISKQTSSKDVHVDKTLLQKRNMMSIDYRPQKRIKISGNKEQLDIRMEPVVPIDKDCWSYLETGIGLTKEMKAAFTNKITFNWIVRNASKLKFGTKIPVVLASVQKGFTDDDRITLEDDSGVIVAVVGADVSGALRSKLVPGTCICLVKCPFETDGSSVTLKIGEKCLVCLTSRETFGDDDLCVPTAHDYIFFKKKNASGVTLLQFATMDWTSIISDTSEITRTLLTTLETSKILVEKTSRMSETSTSLSSPYLPRQNSSHLYDVTTPALNANFQHQVAGIVKKVSLEDEGVSASELLRREKSSSRNPIPTFIQGLDVLLGGGIHSGIITELVGDAGSGRTTLCCQLALNVQAPADLGGLAGECLYIDTQSNFVLQRVREMATAFVEHCTNMVSLHGEILPSAFTTEKVLDNIHVINCIDLSQLFKVINSVPNFLKKNQSIRLLIIDSIAFPFYSTKDGFDSRTQLLYSIGQQLHHIAANFKLAVILTNNLTTAYGGMFKESFIPFLGDGWQHVCNERINLLHLSTSRKAQVIKSSRVQNGEVYFQINEDGIRDA